MTEPRGVLTPYEEKMFEKLHQDFPEMVAGLESGLDVLRGCAWELIRNSPAIDDPDPIARLQAADVKVRRDGALALLAGEGLDRLI